jgi:hypothetical protein
MQLNELIEDANDPRARSRRSSAPPRRAWPRPPAPSVSPLISSCTRCGEAIGQARLDTLPDTFLCVTCVERLQARGSDRNPEP